MRKMHRNETLFLHFSHDFRCKSQVFYVEYYLILVIMIYIIDACLCRYMNSTHQTRIYVCYNILSAQLQAKDQVSLIRCTSKFHRHVMSRVISDKLLYYSHHRDNLAFLDTRYAFLICFYLIPTQLLILYIRDVELLTIRTRDVEINFIIYCNIAWD